MRSLLTLSLLFMLPSCVANAPPEKNIKYVVRVMYVHDLEVKPYDSISRCNVTREFTQNELPPMDGYAKLVICTPVGGL